MNPFRPAGRLMSSSVLALAIWSLSLVPVSAGEIIDFFDSNVRVAKNGDLDVTETVVVQAEGREIRHGIYRDFPVTFRDDAGAVHEVEFKLLGVQRDGKAEDHSTVHQHGIMRIYAGNKDTIVSHGEHTYTFHYRTGRQIRWFDGKPELNWNVTGNFWRFPIRSVSYHLQFAAGGESVRWTAYTGRLGARGTDWRGSLGALGTLSVDTTRWLGPGEGLTVVAEIPAEAVDAPSDATLLWYRLFDNRGWIFGGIGFLVVLGYYFATWEAVGRDPKGGTIIPLFEPPKGISPALANYIRDWGFVREKWRAFTAAALSLAVCGLLRFEQDGKTLTLKSTGKAPPGGFQSLPAGEGAIWTWVNGQGGVGIINKDNGESVAQVGERFTSSIEAENKNRFFRRNLGYALAGFAMTFLVVVGVTKFGGMQDNDIAILTALGFTGFIFGIAAMQVLPLIFGGVNLGGLVRIIMSLAFFAIFVSTSASVVRGLFPYGFGGTLPQAWSYIESYPLPFVLVTAFATINGLFVYLLRAPTALGRPIMDQLAGLRLYLETAEADRMNMSAPEITADRFEALLPYAVALDVEKPWSDAFAAAVRRAHPGEADPMSTYQPSWGSGSGWSGSNFGNAVSSSISGISGALASSVPVSSGSSGFSGGGGSGGGGGGGGGGGW